MSLLGSRELPGWSEEPDEACLSELTDVHAHPTDYRQFTEKYRDETGKISLGKVNITYTDSQEVVRIADLRCVCRSSSAQ